MCRRAKKLHWDGIAEIFQGLWTFFRRTFHTQALWKNLWFSQPWLWKCGVAGGILQCSFRIICLCWAFVLATACCGSFGIPWCSSSLTGAGRRSGDPSFEVAEVFGWECAGLWGHARLRLSSCRCFVAGVELLKFTFFKSFVKWGWRWVCL